MATRRERVVLELEDRFTAELLRAAAAAKAFDRELGNVGRTQPGFTRAVATIERDSSSVGSSIDRLSGRVEILAKAAAAVGPALVPMAAAATPAIAGLTTQLGFAVAAAGTAIFAFQNTGDALEALNKAHLDPTTKNLEKAQQALEELSPSALRFVIELRKMGPAFKEVRDAAEDGLFPGLTASLDDVEALLPKVEGIVSEISSTVGGLANASAEELAGPEWEEFFGFVEREARPTLTRLGQSVGNVTKGLAEMWIAFDPLSDDFQEGLLDATERFEDWAEGLSETEGFQEFVEYVQANGPQVLETLGSIGDAFLQIAEAASPLGGPVLKVLEAMADVISTIADSNLGTPLLTAVSAMSALNLGQAAFQRGGETAFGQRARGRVGGFTEALLNMNAAQRRATLSVQEFADAERQRRATIAKGVGLAAASVAVLATEAGESQAAIFAMTGAMVGGTPGAVAGGAVGAALDLAAANDDVAKAIDKAAKSANAADFANIYGDLDAARASFDKFVNDTNFSQGIFDGQLGLDDWKNTIEGIAGDSDVEEALEQLSKVEGGVENLETAMRELGKGLGTKVFDGIFKDSRLDLAAVEEVLTRAAPAMDAMGISVQDLRDAAERGDGSLVDLVDSIENWLELADSSEGRTQLLEEAMESIGSEMKTTAEAADILEGALSAILDPKIDLAEARDNWRDMLRNLADELSDLEDSEGGAIAGAREVFGDTDGASANREAIRGAVEDLQSLIVKQAEAGRSAEQIGRTVEQEKQNFLDQAEAVGLNRREVEKYVRILGLTPKNVATLIELKNAEEAKRKLDEVTRDRTVKIGFSVADINLMLPKGKTLAQYDVGGWTGPGDRLQPAGIVHAEEFVVRKGPAEAFRPWLEHINSLPGYDSGGFVAARSVAPLPMVGGGLTRDDVAQIVAQARPLYGDVHMAPHNYNEFRREMQQDMALAGSDGVRQP